MASVTFFEFVHATSSIDEHHLARVERMARIADVQLDERILVAVFVLHGVLGIRTAFAEEHVLVAHVFEHDHTIPFWVDA